MAIAQALIDAVVDYAWSDIAKMAKKAMLDLTISQRTMFNGHALERSSLDDMKSLYEMAIAQANAEANSETGGDTALVQRGEPF